MDKEPESNNSTTIDQPPVIKSSRQEALPSPDTTPVESNQPDNHTLKENALSCQIRLTELLKVIANNKRASNNMVSDQHANPGPSGDSCKPLRKAKYSWQVKNLSGHNQSTPTNEGDSPGQEVQELDEVGAGDSTEPPQKKPKLSEDSPSFISLGILSKDTSTNNENHSSCLSTVSVHKSSASSESRSTLDRQEGVIEGSEIVSEEDNRKPSTSNKSPVQVKRAPNSRSSSVLAKWQSKHIAQSIVDNAINATLEVLGFSLAVGNNHPGQAVMAAAQAAQGRTLEEDAVTVVIRARGLQGTEQACSTGDDEPGHAPSLGSEIDQRTHGQSQGQAMQSASHMNPLDPLLGRLTSFTETMSTVDHTTMASSAGKENAETQQDVSGTDTLSTIESSVDLDNLFSPSLQTDVLNKAVCAAISQKGLTVDEDL